MRYLLDLPLGLAVLLGMWSFSAIVLAAQPPSHNTGEDILVFFAIVLSWLLLAVVLACCAGMGGVSGLEAGGGGSVVIALLVLGGIVLIELLPIGITLEPSAAAGWGIDQVGAARLAAFGMLFVLALYAGWIIHAPDDLRGIPGFRYGWPGAVGVVCILACVVSIREMARWDKVAQEEAVGVAQEKAERAQQQRRDFEALTDADPLIKWDEYVGYNAPEDIRTEALRRIALRPHLEAELSELLATDNTLWTRELLSLIVRVPFAPSQALEKPVRDALAVVSAEIRHQATATPEIGSADLHGDKAVDAYETSTLRNALQLAERMAETAGVDLSAELDDMQQAVALYRTSDAARSFPGQVAEAKKQIAKTLAARHG
jgi:hypothetical protein